MDLTGALILVSAALAGTQSVAPEMLVDEVARRTQVRWTIGTETHGPGQAVIWIGTEREFAERLRQTTADHLAPDSGLAAEGYRLLVHSGPAQRAVYVVGHDSRGALFGTGRLLRLLELKPGSVRIADGIDISSSPRFQLRGHQLGYRSVPNSYDAWDLEQWRQYFRDLIVFGVNAVELVPPRTDASRNSPHFPLPPLEMMAGMSALADRHELDVWIWYPAIIGDYARPEVAQEHLDEAEEIFRRLPRIDAVFVPGGDPGKTDPAVLMPFLEQKAALLRRHHPKAEIWMSPQGYGPDYMHWLLQYLRQKRPAWLGGLVYGPGIRLDLHELRQQVPATYPIRSYPDITHTFHCQYPVPNWDPAFALTEGREPINPRPRDQARIFDIEKQDVVGWITYSEGCNDDVNKIVWSALAWDPEAKLEEVLREYARYYIDPRLADDFARGLFALEQNWRGALATNDGVAETLALFRSLEERVRPAVRRNWRFQMAQFRAYYDAFLYHRLRFESRQEEEAIAALARAPERGSAAAIEAAKAVLQAPANPIIAELRGRVFELGAMLFQSIGLQLSVEKYDAIAVNRGANLDLIDFPLNNRRWLLAQFREIRALPEEHGRLERLAGIVHWEEPRPGTLYDDLGVAGKQPHLVRGTDRDDELRGMRSPLDDFELIKEPALYRQHPYRYSWLSRASTLYDTPLRLRYEGLDQSRPYRLRVVYPADRDDLVPRIRLVADGHVQVHPFIARPIPAQPLEFAIPAPTTADGQLTLDLTCEQTEHGNGRGTQIAEIWLIPDGP